MSKAILIMPLVFNNCCLVFLKIKINIMIIP